MTNIIRTLITMVLVMVAVKAGVNSFHVEWNKIDESGLCYNTTISEEEAEEYENTYESIFGTLPQ